MGQYTNEKGYQGLIIPDERISVETWTSAAAEIQEAGPRPGQAVPNSSAVRGIVRTHGQQDDSTYGVNIVRGGYGTDANFTWDHILNGAPLPTRGWNSPSFAQDLTYIGGGSTSGETAGTPAVVTLGSGRMVWIYAVKWGPEKFAVWATSSDSLTAGDIIGGSGGVVLTHDDVEGVLYSESTYYGASPNGLDCVCARWDEARQVVQCWVRMTVGDAGGFQFYLFESANAQTWELVQRNCLSSVPLSELTLYPPSVAKSNGCTVIVQPDNNDTDEWYVHQFVSYDDGRNFSRPFGMVEVEFQEYALAEFRGGIVCAARNGSDDSVNTGVLSGPFDDISYAPLEDIASPSTGFDISLAVMFDRVWMCFSTGSRIVRLRTSSTGLYDSWSSVGFEPMTFESSAATITTNYAKIQPGLGGLILTLSPVGPSIEEGINKHLVTIRLGGWSAVCLPASEDERADTARYGFGPIAGDGSISVPPAFQTYYPFVLPEEMERSGTPLWEYTPTGSPPAPAITSSLTTGLRLTLELDGTTGEQHTYTSYFGDGLDLLQTVDLDKGAMVYFDARQNSGGATGRLTLTVVQDSELYFCRVYFNGASDTVFVGQGGDSVVFTGSDSTVRRQYIVAMKRTIPGGSDVVATLYRTNGGTTDDRFTWKLVGTVVVEPSASAADDHGEVEFNMSGNVSAFFWIHALHYLGYCGRTYLDDLATQPELGTYLYGAPCGSSPSELTNGLKVSFSKGPFKVGDTFTIAPKYDYAKEHLYPRLYPSPRQEWRSVAKDEMHLEWTFNGNDIPEGFDTSSLAICLLNTNLFTATLQGFDASETWVDLIDLDLYSEFSGLSYYSGFKAGGTITTAPYIVPADDTLPASRYIHENELAGGWAHFEIEVGVFTNLKILRNTAGWWGPSTMVGKKPRIYLDYSGVGEGTAIVGEGTVDIVPPRVMGMVHGLGGTNYSRLRLKIPEEQPSPNSEEFYKIGQLILGSCYVFGKSYSHGRVISRRANTTLSTYVGGGKASVVNGPTSRAVQFAWADGIDSQPLHLGSSDYVTVGSASGSEHAVADRSDLTTQLDGLYGRLDGSHVPIVYVARIPYASEDSTYLTTDPEVFCYGRTMSPLEVTTIRGQEAHSEVSTIASVTVEEDV